MDGILQGAAGVGLRWTGASGILYTVEQLTRLEADPQQATRIATSLAGEGDWTFKGVTDAPGPGPWIYRVGVE